LISPQKPCKLPSDIKTLNAPAKGISPQFLRKRVKMPEIIQYWGHYFVWNWLDVLWLPLALLIVHRGQKWKACAFVILCMTVLRLQIEIADGLGFKKGVTGLIDWPLIIRGYAVYGFFISLYLLLSYLSPFTRGAIYLAASITIFFMAFTVSSIVLIF